MSFSNSKLKSNIPKRVVFAAGGTGGHLFPAQALAKELEEEGIEVKFAGKNLATNRFFDKERFSFKEIQSATPYSIKQCFKSPFFLLKGCIEAYQFFRQYLPELVIGFGSFYSFPLLFIARFLQIPYILVETNVLPGRVNRFFAKKSCFSAIQFQKSATWLKGNTQLATIPVKKAKKMGSFSVEEARLFYQLDPHRRTILIFGGSQGANAINTLIPTLDLPFPWQAIHLCGAGGDVESLHRKYRERNILAYVKPFETEMERAWKAADLVICRAGAATLAEIIHFTVPAIVIPWELAAENHQMINGQILEEKKGGVVLSTQNISELDKVVTYVEKNLEQMKRALFDFSLEQQGPPLQELILKTLQELHKGSKTVV